jgi:SAM-dependent methyltransferase
MLSEVLGDGLVVGGTAEAVPLGAASADCVVVGHAFHHFDPHASQREIHRVLRPEGVLALFWIVSDPGDPVDAALDEMVGRYVDPACPIYKAFHGWQDAFRDSELFAAIGEGVFPGRHDLAAADLPLLWATSSDVASLPEDKRRALLAEIAAFAEGLPQRITLPVSTRVHLYARA